MAVKFANLASSTLASSLTNSATSISITDASSFPTLGSGDYFYASIGEGSLSEIVKVTAVSSNTFTAVRGQDGTTARSHDSGTSVALRVVAAALDDIASAADTESVSISGDTMTGNLSFGDNDKVILGAGNDLEIFSTGSAALIKAGNATSDIRIESDNRLVIADRGFNEAFAVFNDDSDVKLYHDGTQRLATTSSGVDVTGGITSGGLTVDYTGHRTGDAGLLVTNDASDWGVKIDKDGTDTYGLLVQADGTHAIMVRSSSGVQKALISGTGNADFSGALSISGTTVISSTRRLSLRAFKCLPTRVCMRLMRPYRTTHLATRFT